MVESFDDRGQAFEKKEALSAEKQFKLRARRNRKLATWVSDKLGHDSSQAETYAKAVIASDFEEVGDDDVLRKVLKDLNDGGIVITDKEVRSKMDELMNEVNAAAQAE